MFANFIFNKNTNTQFKSKHRPRLAIYHQSRTSQLELYQDTSPQPQAEAQEKLPELRSSPNEYIYIYAMRVAVRLHIFSKGIITLHLIVEIIIIWLHGCYLN